MKNDQPMLTSDRSIRIALKKKLEGSFKANNNNVKIIDELGIQHGKARIDIAVINGIIHGYELKSDVDTLFRLPEQIRIYNSVLDKVTLVVGKKHAFEAIKIIPEWWGVTIAKAIDPHQPVTFFEIREAESNPFQDSVSMAGLLWKEEALNILENINCASGLRLKTRRLVYERLAEVLDPKTLRKKISECLCARPDWRVEIPCMPNGD